MTLTEFIAQEKAKPFHMQDCFFKQILYPNDEKISPQLVLESCILNNYFSELNTYKKKVSINEYQRQNFKFNPKKLSLEAYDSTEYWFLILHANELFSASEFSLDKNYIYMYSSGIQEVINEILNIERPYINKNNAEISNYITANK